jgi:metallophosphoesterase superfamily enzyme
VLGETHESIERDGWLLLHGDRYVAAARCIIGHLHPSIALGGERSAPAFLASPEIIVVPALTPYSRGLNVLSGACAAALKAFVRSTASVCVVACGEDKVYPFGSLAGLRTLLRSGRPSRFARRRLNATSSSDSV